MCSHTVQIWVEGQLYIPLICLHCFYNDFFFFTQELNLWFPPQPDPPLLLVPPALVVLNYLQFSKYIKFALTSRFLHMTHPTWPYPHSRIWVNLSSSFRIPFRHHFLWESFPSTQAFLLSLNILDIFKS